MKPVTNEEIAEFRDRIFRADDRSLEVLGIYDLRKTAEWYTWTNDINTVVNSWKDIGKEADIYRYVMWHDEVDNEDYPVCCHCGAQMKTTVVLYAPDLPLFGMVGETCLENRFAGRYQVEFANMTKRAQLSTVLEEAGMLDDADTVTALTTLVQTRPNLFEKRLTGVVNKAEALQEVYATVDKLSKEVYAPFQVNRRG